MAKLTLDDVGNLNTAGLATINENSSRIEAAFENTLSRDGTAPNQMEADLDLNHNDIINVDNIDAEIVLTDYLYVNGSQVIPGDNENIDVTKVFDAISIDEDDMVSDRDDKLPTQQSVKAYVDSQVPESLPSPTGHPSEILGANDTADGYEFKTLSRVRGSRVITPYDFGGTDATRKSDNTAVIQAMFDALASSWDATDQEFLYEVEGGGGTWYCDDEVGLTKLLQPGANIRNLRIHSRNTGGIGLNFGGTNSPTLTNVRVYGNKDNAPAVGIYIGVVDSGTIGSPTGSFPPASECKMIGCKTGGYFSKTAVWNMGSEVMGLSSCFFRNRHRSITAATYVGTSNAQCFEDRFGAVVSDLVVLPTAALGAKSNVCHDFGQGAILREADVNLSITGATQTNPVVLSYSPTALAAAGLSNGDWIFVHDVDGMTELNNKNFVIANIDTSAGTLELSATDGTGYGAYTSGGVTNNRTGPPIVIEGAGLVHLKAGYALGFGTPSIDFVMTYGGALRNVDISFQGETNPLSAVFFTMDSTDRTIQGPFKVSLLSAAQTYGISMFDKTSGGSLSIDGFQCSVSSMTAAPPFQMFHLPGQFKLRNAQIEVPATGLMNAISGFGAFTGTVKVNGSSPSMSFYGDVAVNGVTSIDSAGGIRLVSYTATQIADITHAVNTANKAAGKMVRDSTNNRVMVANGSGAGGSWTVCDGSASVTPT